jgi:glycosyltransferase involved in cell wall biosynthesis
MLSVVIPVFNNKDVLGPQLEAVLGQEVGEDFEVVVADNGSTDGSRDVVLRYRAADPRVRLVDASARRGPAAARNLGAAAAVSDRIFFCDGDDVAQPGWLAGLRDALATSDIAVGGLDMCSLNGQAPCPAQDPCPPHFRFLAAGLSANMAVRRAAFEAVGGFDEDLRVGEDVDLCWRMQMGGSRLERQMDAVVAKRARPIGGKLFSQSVGYGRSDVALFRRFRDAGMPRQAWQAVRVWGWLVLNVWTVARPGRRTTWFRALFIQIGHLLGSVEQRVFYP